MMDIALQSRCITGIRVVNNPVSFMSNLVHVIDKNGFIGFNSYISDLKDEYFHC